MTRALRLAGPIVAALVLASLAAALATWSAARAQASMADLNREDVALAAARPVTAPRTAPLARRVVLVIVDGLGAWATDEVPSLGALARRGASGIAHSHSPTISRPNYVSILTGVPPLHSGVRTNEYARPVPLDSLFRVARAAGSRTAFVTDAASSVATLFAGDLDEAAYAPWTGGFAHAAELALSRDYPLLVLLPSAIDQCGHHHRMAGARCRAAAAEVDHQLAAVVASLDLTRDAIVVTADHGHLRGGGHGGRERDVLEVPLVLAGAGVRVGAVPRAAELVDVAPTVAALLGLPAPGHGLGRTLTEVLALEPATAAATAAIDGRRVARNRRIVDAEQAAAVLAEDGARRGRAALVGLGLLLALVVLAAARRVGLVRIDRRIALVAFHGLPLTAVALFATSDGPLSLSCFGNEDEWGRRLLVAGVAAAITSVAVHVGLLRGHASALERATTVNSVAALALLGSAAATGVVWATCGGAAPIVLPGELALFLRPAVSIAVVPHALAVAATLTIELIAVAARSAGALPFAAADERDRVAAATR